jgi:CHASE2 domain-containing sensor protein
MVDYCGQVILLPVLFTIGYSLFYYGKYFPQQSVMLILIGGFIGIALVYFAAPYEVTRRLEKDPATKKRLITNKKI